MENIDLLPLVQLDNSLNLLIAPPAWGKTTILLDLFKRSNRRWVFLSPLRALANEFYVRSCKVISSILVSNSTERDQLVRAFISQQRSLLIITPELCNEKFFTQVEALDEKPIFIFDEFHLFYYWGESFRPVMREIFFAVGNSNSSVLALSATISAKNMELMKIDVQNGFEQSFIIDFGNHTFRNHPSQIFYYPGIFKRKFIKSFEYDLVKSRGKCLLFFCQYRSQVDQLVERYHRLGYSVLGCKGGEAAEFTNQLMKVGTPDCIFATTTLSHGVNLPSIDKVYLGYPVRNLDFWIQMAARGGRNGSPYVVHTFDPFFQTIKHRIFSTTKVLCRQIYQQLFFFFHGTAKEY